jgi:uncharacterized protein (TIGR02246 family)
MAAAAAALALRPPPAPAQEEPARLAYRLAGMDEVRVERGLPYKPLDSAPGNRDYGEALELDVYRPPTPGSNEPLPALVFVHGGIVPGTGEPLPKDWPAYQEWGRLAAAAGFIGITFNHRMTTRDNIAEAAGDVADLITYVRRNAVKLGVDGDRLCVAIFSAGGPLASLFLREPSPWMRCVVLYYPYLDLEHLRRASPFREAYAADTVDALEAYSPATYLDRLDLPPILLARAGRDAIPGLNASIERFVRAAVARDVTLDFLLHRAGDHGFDMRNQDDRSRDIVRQTIEFVRRHLGVDARDSDARASTSDAGRASARELTADDRAAVGRAHEAYRAAWLANDADAVLATLTPDAVLVPHHGLPPVEGATAIRRFWWPPDGPPTRITAFDTTVAEVGGSGDVAYVRGRFSLRWVQEESETSEVLSNAGSFLSLLRRQPGGGWRITHQMWDDPPPETP